MLRILQKVSFVGVGTEVAEFDALACPDAFRSDPPRRRSGVVVGPHD